jgi:hypothetical protein
MTEPIPYRPAQRSVPCRVFTFAGWVTGTMHPPARAHLIDFLNRSDAILRVTDATVPGQSEVHPFFALARNAIIAVLVVDPRERLGAAREGPPPVVHRTSWLLPSGLVIDGSLELLEGVRISDHLMHRLGFIALHDCTFFAPDESGAIRAEPGVREIALQTSRAIGVSEIT